MNKNGMRIAFKTNLHVDQHNGTFSFDLATSKWTGIYLESKMNAHKRITIIPFGNFDGFN